LKITTFAGNGWIEVYLKLQSVGFSIIGQAQVYLNFFFPAKEEIPMIFKDTLMDFYGSF
jgi:hypothetical protein